MQIPKLFKIKPSWNDLKLSVPILALVFLLGTLIEPIIGHVAVGIFYMIAIAVSGLFFARITLFSLALLLILVYYYWLFPPVFTFSTQNPKDLPTIIALFIAAVSIGGLVNLLKSQATTLKGREEANHLLYILARQLAQAQSRDDVAQTSCTAMRDLFNESVALLFFTRGEAGKKNQLELLSVSDFKPSEAELQELQRAFEEGEQPKDFAIQKTSTGKAYMPLIGREGLVGILLIEDSRILSETNDKLQLAATFSHQIAVAIERENFHAGSRKLEVMEQTQKLYKTLLNSVSHELKTPLVAITGSSSALIDEHTSRDPLLVQSLASEILTASIRLRGVVENLLDMSRIDSGMLKPKRELHDTRDIMAVVLQRLELEGYPHSIQLDFQNDIPEIWVDAVLVDQALANIIHNAWVYTPKDRAIEIFVSSAGEFATIAIRDYGPGLPGNEPGQVFEKFYRGSPQNPGGLGLGLSIAQGFIEAQGGRIEASNHPKGGAIFKVYIPCQKQDFSH